jgi:beta-carotene 3-hydroxylase
MALDGIYMKIITSQKYQKISKNDAFFVVFAIPSMLLIYFGSNTIHLFIIHRFWNFILQELLVGTRCINSPTFLNGLKNTNNNYLKRT